MTGWAKVNFMPFEAFGASHRDSTIATWLLPLGVGDTGIGIAFVAWSLLLMPGPFLFGIGYLIYRWLATRHISDVETVLIGVVIASYSAYLLTSRVGGQANSGFLYAGQIAGPILGAVGFVTLFGNLVAQRRSLLQWGCTVAFLAVPAGLAIIQVVASLTSAQQSLADGLPGRQVDRLWRGEQPEKIVEALRRRGDTNDAFMLLLPGDHPVQRNVRARNIWISQLDGMWYVGGRNDLRRFANFYASDEGRILHERNKITKDLYRPMRPHRQDSRPVERMQDLADTLNPQADLFFVMSTSSQVSAPNKLEEVARDGPTVLYRLRQGPRAD
jgi:hypothetical protein